MELSINPDTITKYFSKFIRPALGLSLLAAVQSLLVSTATAQSTPTDLTLLGIEDILKRRIIPHDEATGSPISAERWSFGYNFVTAHFKEYQTGTQTLSTAHMQTLFPVLPYTMQVGSGTFDFNPSLNYIRKMGKFEWANNLQGTVRMGKNYHDYSLSHRAVLKTTLSYELFPFLYPSVKLLGHY